MTYRLLFGNDAQRTLRNLDNSASTRILRKLGWLADHADEVLGEGLRGELSGNMKLREGDYRIVYYFRRDESEIVVVSIGHRSEVYKRK